MYNCTQTHGHYNIKPLEPTQMSNNGKQVKKITGWPYMKGDQCLCNLMGKILKGDPVREDLGAGH